MVGYSELSAFYKDKRVFITGHTGFKGSWLCLLLRNMGADITGYALEPPTTPSLFEQANLENDIAHIIGDVRDLEHLTKAVSVVKPEIVIHMAAQPLVRESYKIPVETYAINVMGTVNLLEGVRQNPGVKAVVNVTTDKCYENQEWHWGYRENEPMGGFDPYSNSKGCSELVTASYRSSYFSANAYSEHGVAIGTARAGNVIGGGDWAEDRLIPDFIRSIIQGEKVQIRSPYAIRPWQHVLEPLTGYLTLAKALYQHGPTFAEGWNFGPDDSDSQNVEWITKRICQLWGNGAKFEIDKKPQPHEANYLKLDCSKAKAELGWIPVWNIEQTLESIVEWTKAYLDKRDLNEVCTSQIEDYFNN